MCVVVDTGVAEAAGGSANDCVLWWMQESLASESLRQQESLLMQAQEQLQKESTVRESTLLRAQQVSH